MRNQFLNKVFCMCLFASPTAKIDSLDSSLCIYLYLMKNRKNMDYNLSIELTCLNETYHRSKWVLSKESTFFM